MLYLLKIFFPLFEEIYKLIKLKLFNNIQTVGQIAKMLRKTYFKILLLEINEFSNLPLNSLVLTINYTKKSLLVEEIHLRDILDICTVTAEAILVNNSTNRAKGL